jgi:serine/threonine protein kinase
MHDMRSRRGHGARSECRASSVTVNAPQLALASATADRYTVIREVGAGGMATVYLAHELKHDGDVTI